MKKPQIRYKFFSYAILILALFTSISATSTADITLNSKYYINKPLFPQKATPVSGGCQIFPKNNYWNTPVNNLPPHPQSTAWINSIGATRGFHMDFGSGAWNGGPIGIPFNITLGSQTPHYTVDFYYPGESDNGPYPIPSSPAVEYGSDHHILIVDSDDCELYEIYDAWQSSGNWFAGSGAIWDLNSNTLRPDTWTSADAAGLPIFPGLARYDEIAAGEITHALRFTTNCTANYYVWPARHMAQYGSCANPVPFGARFRLKSNYNISGFSSQAQIILRAMKTYGIVLADNGSPWYVSGVPNEGWDNDALHELDIIIGNNFEAVDTTGLVIDENSGETYTATENVETRLNGVLKGSYFLDTKESIRDAYFGMNSGPAEVVSTNAIPILNSIRVLYGGVSYSEIMGFPASQLTNDYWFPYYNNVAMNSQLRVGNVGGVSTTITITYGNDTPLDTYTLAPGAATRKNYPGLNSGPLHVTSSVSNILTTIRVLYADKSYSELTGFPNNQLTQDYWYPYYNNVAMNSQLRVSNVGGAPATITVTSGDNILLDSYTLSAGEATRKNYAGINSGPLHVTSSDSNILTTIRVLYADQSYSELSGYPANQLTKEYAYPIYDNVTADSQLRVSNVGGVETTITVYGANNAVIDSYTLAAGAATRKNYAMNNGPLHVVSSASNILSSQRLLYTTPSFSSFYELTGFPTNQLTTDYYFPWYNNVAMSSQLRIAVP
jgi:hypothetical protein